MNRQFLLFSPTGYSWLVTDPVLWLLANVENPFLEKVRDRLLMLGPEDGPKVLRLAMWCRLSILSFTENRVICCYRGESPELRPFLRRHRLDQHEVACVNTDLVVIQPATAILTSTPLSDEAWTLLDV